MRAHAVVVAEARDGRTVFPVLRSDPPLTLRATPTGLHVVGSAAGPLGGDRLRLDVEVGPGAAVCVRSVAASLVQPGPRGGRSVVSLHAEVGPGGLLSWLPEPTVAVAGCDHEARARIDLAPGATLRWREELVWGRHAEPGGSILQRVEVDRAGRPLVRHELAVGPRWPGSLGPAGTAGARAVGSLLAVDPEAAATAEICPAGSCPDGIQELAPAGGRARFAVLDIAPGTVLVSALADDVSDLRDALPVPAIGTALGQTSVPASGNRRPGRAASAGSSA